MKNLFPQSASDKSRWLSAALAAVIAILIIGSGSGATGALAQAAAPGQPDAVCPAGGQCFADVPPGNPFYTFINRIYQQELVTGYPCGGVGEPCDAQNRPYYRPVNNVTRQQMAKFIDNARRLPQIDITVASGDPPVRSRNDAGTAITASSTSGQALTAQSSTGLAIYAQTGEASAITGYSTGNSASSVGVYGSGNTGVRGQSSSDSGYGVYGVASGYGGIGVRGYGDTAVLGEGDTTNSSGVVGIGHGNGDGVYGSSDSADGVYGQTDTGNAIYGWGYPNGWAGWFVGNVRITGTCCAMGEAYTQIDDPLDPANKYLNQSLVQSADMSTLINGNVTLDANGEATVTVPAWFQASTGDYRYTLTAVGAPGPNLYIAQELAENQFKIAGGKAGAKVSWQVTGIRQDPYAQQHPISVEEEKPANEQGKYLHPTEYGQPESAGVNYGQHSQQLNGGKP